MTPFPQFTGAGIIDHWASSIYHGLSARAERRFSRGFSFMASYAWTKLIDDNLGNGANAFFNGGNNGVQDWDNLRAERAVSTAHLPHRLVLSGLWELPFAQNAGGVVKAIAGGWQINSVVTIQSGEPIGVTQNGVAFGGNRPNVVGDPTVENPNIDRWLNADAFRIIQPFQYGDAPRNLPGTRTDSLFMLINEEASRGPTPATIVGFLASQVPACHRTRPSPTAGRVLQLHPHVHVRQPRNESFRRRFRNRPLAGNQRQPAAPTRNEVNL
jgi:hypothetical protein